MTARQQGAGATTVAMRDDVDTGVVTQQVRRVAMRRLAGALWVVAAAVTLGSLVLQIAAAEVDEGLLHTLSLLAYPTVGAIIARHQPRHPIAWVLLASGMGFLLEDVTIAYAELGLVAAPGSVPAPAVVAVLGDAFWFPSLALALTFTFLLLPDGHLPSPRWRPVVWAAGAALALSVPLTLLKPGEIYAVRGVDNPLGWPAAEPVLHVVELTSLPVILLTALLAGVSFVLRYRRSTPAARLQMRALVAAVVVLLVVIPLTALSTAVTRTDWLASILYEVALVIPPVGVGVAVLRYRLYEIDRVVTRTVTWTVVSAVLAGVYAALVLAAQAVLGLEDASDLVVATATLAAAALVRPVRARVQQLVDRRFDRARYDAALEVEVFGARLRDQVDLRALLAEVESVTARTVAPAGAWVWLADGGRR